MENLEQICLEKLNKILSKFDLKIESIHNALCNVWQYRLVDNSNLPETTYFDWLASWTSISNILMHRNSIFECLSLYSSYQRYINAYNNIKYLENISSLEEFLIKCDLIGV
jgi:hypothetical protein